jgi:hypothetical protein
VAMRLTGHKTEAVCRRYAITSEADLREGMERRNESAPGSWNRAIGSDPRRARECLSGQRRTSRTSNRVSPLTITV